MKRFFPALACLLMLTGTLCLAGEARQSKVLIMYFSLTGNTIPVAETIQRLTGGDLLRIETVREYPIERPARTEIPKQELDSGIWPDLKTAIPDMSQYDIILVGGPVWWYTVSTPLRSLLQSTDFAGKQVALFVTHDGGLGDYCQYFEQNVRNGVVREGLDLYRPFDERPEVLEKKIRDWLSGFN